MAGLCVRVIKKLVRGKPGGRDRGAGREGRSVILALDVSATVKLTRPQMWTFTKNPPPPSHTHKIPAVKSFALLFLTFMTPTQKQFWVYDPKLGFLFSSTFSPVSVPSTRSFPLITPFSPHVSLFHLSAFIHLLTVLWINIIIISTLRL